MSESKGWKSGIVLSIEKTKGGLPLLWFKRAKKEEGKTQFFALVLQIGSVVPNPHEKFKLQHWKEGAKIKDKDTYYEQPFPLKGDNTHQDLNEGEPEIVEYNNRDVVKIMALSQQQATDIVCAAMTASGGNIETFDSMVDLMKKTIEKIVNG